MNFKVCPKKPRSQQFSGFSSEMGVANSVVMTCPETLTHQLKRCWFETVSILHAVETCTRNRQFRAGLIYGKIVQQLKGYIMNCARLSQYYKAVTNL